MIVADTCVLIHLFNQTALTSQAELLLQKDPFWMVPHLWQEEYANVISKLARKEDRPTAEVLGHYNYVRDELKEFERIVDSAEALRFALTHKISVYDAHFVVLALELDIWVVTEDAEILKKCPKQAITMKDFCHA